MNGFLVEEGLRATGIAIAFLAIFAAAEIWRRLRAPDPEFTRKLVHFAGGVVALGLPWLVRSHWTVLLLGASLGLVLLLTKRLGLLSSIHGVERRSEGVVYFPVAVYLVFLLAAARPVLYLVSVLALVVSDALAALVGSTYGRITYRVERDRRSMEGSAVFFLATFLAVHLPLLLLTDVDRDVCVLVAVQIALLVTILEAVSLGGADNLIVPIGTYLLLLELLPQPASTLLVQLLAQIVILALLFLLAWRLRMLTASGTLAASLFFYAAYTLGGLEWLIAAAVGLIAFGVVLRLAAEIDHGPSARFQVLAVFYTTLVPAAVILLNDVVQSLSGESVWRAGQEPLYPVFLGTLAAQLSLLCLVFWEGTPWLRTVRPTRAGGSLLVGLGTMLPPALLMIPEMSPRAILAATSLPLLSLLLYVAVNRFGALPRERPWDGRLRAICVGVSALLVAPLLLSTPV